MSSATRQLSREQELVEAVKRHTGIETEFVLQRTSFANGEKISDKNYRYFKSLDPFFTYFAFFAKEG
jgi:hypothetical protein